MSWLVGANVTISWGVMVKWGKNVMITWGQAHVHLCYHDVMIIWGSLFALRSLKSLKSRKKSWDKNSFERRSLIPHLIMTWFERRSPSYWMNPSGSYHGRNKITWLAIMKNSSSKTILNVGFLHDMNFESIKNYAIDKFWKQNRIDFKNKISEKISSNPKFNTGCRKSRRFGFIAKLSVLGCLCWFLGSVIFSPKVYSW